MFRSKTDDFNARDAAGVITKIGTDLSLRRVKRGERLEDIAEYLAIKSIYLYGIELGDLSIMSSKRHVHSYIASYANYLGLDGEAIKDRLLPVINSLEGDKAPSSFWGVAHLDRGSSIVLGASILLGIYAGWSYLGDVARLDLIAPPVTAKAISEPDDAEITAIEAAVAVESSVAVETPVENVDDVAEAFPVEAEKALADLQDQAAEAERTSAQQALADEKLGAEADGTILIATVDNEQATEPLAARQELPANVLATLVAKRGDGATIHEPQNTDARVIVRALDTSWIQISSADRSYIWTRTMQPREMLLVPNRDDLELWAGDASGVEILLDGAVLPTLGPPGTVVRGISLVPESLEAISAGANVEGSAKPTF